MARRVRMSESAQGQLRSRMTERLGRRDVSDVGELRSMIDRYGRREVNRRYAEAAGIRETSARDSITRFLRGTRAPSSRTLDRMGRARRGAQADELRRPGVTPSIIGTFQISSTRWRGRVRAVGMTARERETLADAYERDDMDRVADVIARRYGKHFHDHLSDVDEIDDFEL